MKTQKVFTVGLLFLLSLISGEGVWGTVNENYSFRPEKLFVFGDSYADTGNQRKTFAPSWKFPYGITFPGKPAGRFSDGRVLTDFIARLYGIRSPIPYRWRGFAGKKVGDGMNMAYGGTGVFDTEFPGPNMTVQIDLFESLISQSLYSNQDLQSSMALVTLSGNDYSAYLLKGGLFQDIPAFITQVVKQVTININRLHTLGIKKVAVTSLQPLGCLPGMTILNSFQQCNATQNAAVNIHNLLLRQTIDNLNINNNNTSGAAFFIIDLNTAFNTVLENKGFVGEVRFESPLKPCCMGINYPTNSCGSMNDKGQKMYTMCNDPKSSFFWDMVHPTEAGWRAVYLTLKSSLEQIN